MQPCAFAIAVQGSRSAKCSKLPLEIERVAFRVGHAERAAGAPRPRLDQEAIDLCVIKVAGRGDAGANDDHHVEVVVGHAA